MRTSPVLDSVMLSEEQKKVKAFFSTSKFNEKRTSPKNKKKESHLKIKSLITVLLSTLLLKS